MPLIGAPTYVLIDDGILGITFKADARDKAASVPGTLK